MTPESTRADRESFLALRLGAAVLALPLTVVAVRLVRATIIASSTRSLSILDNALMLAFVAASALCWWFVIGASSPINRRLMLHTIVGAAGLGGVSFAVGFFGPIIIAPTANQGPLLGIFVTGPLGFAIGALVGLVVGLFRLRSKIVR